MARAGSFACMLALYSMIIEYAFSLKWFFNISITKKYGNTMDTKQDTFLEKIGAKGAELILKNLNLIDYFNMKFVCKSWESTINALPIDKKVSSLKKEVSSLNTVHNSAWYDPIMGKVNTLNFPLTTVLLTNALITPIVHRTFYPVPGDHELRDQLVTFIMYSSVTGSLGALWLIGEDFDNVRPKTKSFEEVNQTLSETCSYASVGIAAFLYFSSRASSSNLIISIAQSIFTYLSPVLAYAVTTEIFSTINEFSFFCKNKPKLLQANVAEVLKSDIPENTPRKGSCVIL